MNELNVFTDVNIPEIVYENYIEDKLEQDLVIPDYYCSARKIVCCDARTVVLNKRFSDGKVVLEGVCTWKILYLSEEDNILHQITCDKPFTEFFSVPAEQGTIRYKIKVKNVTCKLLSSQKADCKALLCIALKIMGNEDKKMLVDCSEPLTQLQKKETSVLESLGDYEKEFKVAAEMSIRRPEDYNVYSVLSQIALKECKCYEDKVIVKGICKSKAVLLHKEKNEVECQECETPFSQIIEADGCTENCCATVNFDVLEVECSPQNVGDEMMLVSSTIQLQMSVFSLAEMSLCIDAYHSEKVLNISRETFELYKDIRSFDIPARLTQNVHLNTRDIRILFLQAKGDIDKIDVQDGIMIVDGKINVCLVYSLEDETYQTTTSLPFQTTKSVDFEFDRLKCEAEVLIDNLTYIILSDSEIELTCEAKVPLTVYIAREIGCISDLSVGEEATQAKLDAPLVVYYADKGETIWDIGKKYAVPISVLKANNELDEDVLSKPQLIFVSKR